MSLPETTASVPARAFTVKALVGGFAGVLVITVYAILHDIFVRQGAVIGNHMPAVPYALVLAVALLWNPLAGRLSARLAFSVRELVVVLGLMLLAAWVPSSGFLRYFQRETIVPTVMANGKAEWKEYATLDYLPAQAFPLERTAGAHALKQAIAATNAATAEEATARTLLAYAPPAVVAGRPLSAEAETLLRQRTQSALERAGGHADALAMLAALPSLMPMDGTPPAYAALHARVSAAYTAALPAAEAEYARVYDSFRNGIDPALPVSQVPWASWLPPLRVWAPLIICLTVALLALTLVVHRQWARHEQLGYPIATVTSAMLTRAPGRLLPDIVSNRLFWFGVVPVMGIHAINYLAVWFPGRIPDITLGWDIHAELQNLFPSTKTANEAWAWQGNIKFIVIGLAYFIASEMSLSMGLSAILLTVLACQTYLLTGTPMGNPDFDATRAGAYLAMAAVLLYTGRTYYWAVTRAALGLSGRAGAQPVERQAAWAARLVLAGFIGVWACLTWGFALDWFVALLYVLLVGVFFLVFTRIVCETGVPFLQAGWQPGLVLAQCLGLGALGPGPLVTLAWLGTIITQDPRECLMPYAATVLKVSDNHGVKQSRMLGVGGLGIAVALVVGFVVLTVCLYRYGGGKDEWAAFWLPSGVYDVATKGVASLADTGLLARADAAHGLAKLPLIAENFGNGRALGWMSAGAGLVVMMSLMRFRFAWWPLHPVAFLVWGTYPMRSMWSSFLIGWAIKELVVRFGGSRSYQSLKPLFIGLIVGELIAVTVVLVIGLIYFLVTGDLPKTYNILPG